ncbi:MAG: TolC family protein [Muribaculaceae bacterium]|nr:TolC family protein [Muribaculaceae bacterium]
MTISNKLASGILAAAFAVAATGCHIYQKFEMPDSTALTREYVEAKAAEVDSTSLGALPWQQVFTDPMLTDLINQALENNTDLKNAKLNIDVAHANMLGARLSYLPSVALAPQGGNSATNLPGGGWSNKNWTYNIPLSVSWEIDVFGKTLNTKRSAETAYEMSKDYEQAVRSQIIGGVANCYYAISTLAAQLELQKETAKIWSESIETMKAMKEAGMTTEAAVVQSTAQYYSILASISDLETSLEQANTTLSLLVGQMPQSWPIQPALSVTLPAEFNAGVPMVALANRPDVRAQERQLAIAYYTTNSARAAFYPSLSISANGGFTNSLGTMIFNPGKWFVNLAGQLTAPLFARGQNIARLKASKAQQEQALNTFEYTVMKAAGDVSNALTAYENVRSKEEMLRKQVDCMTQAVDITETLFTNSATNYNTTYLEVLTAQQNLLGTQMGLLNCALARSQAVVNLYQSLGGGGGK